MVNSLLTILIKVNVLTDGVIRRVATGDEHEVQEGDCGAWPPELASRLRLERRRRQRLIDFRPFGPDFCRKLDDLRLGVDRLSASASD